MCVARMKQCNNIGALAQELDIHRRMLYRWRDQLDPAAKSEEGSLQPSREARLRQEVNRLKRLLADKTLEVDFFKGALQKVEARRRQSGFAGEKAYTTKHNASCESFLKTLKREEIHANDYQDLGHLYANVEAFIQQYYNRRRLHSALGYRAPEDFEK